MKLFCTHQDCRAHTSEEVAYMAERLPDPERRAQLAQLARDVLTMEVRCRHVTRAGGFPAPLPPVRA